MLNHYSKQVYTASLFQRPSTWHLTRQWHCASFIKRYIESKPYLRYMKKAWIFFLCVLIIINTGFYLSFERVFHSLTGRIFISLVFCSIVFLLYLSISYLLRKFNIRISVLADSFLLFAISELAFFLLSGGNLCFFGIIHLFSWYQDTINKVDREYDVFWMHLEFASSISCLISAIVFFLYQKIVYKKTDSIPVVN
jgi:hypothetical protein